MRGFQLVGRDALLFQLFLEGGDGGGGPGNDALLRSVDSGEGKLGVEPLRCFRLGYGNGEHAAFRDFSHQVAPRADEGDRVFQGENAAQAGGGIFAEAVANEPGRTDAPRHPELGQRVFHGEEDGLRIPRQLDLLGGLGGIRFRRIEEITEIEVEVGTGIVGTRVDPFPKDGFVFVELAAHVDVLHPLAGKEEGHRVQLGGFARGGGGRVRQIKTLEGLLLIMGDDHAAVGKFASTDMKRIGDVREIRLGMAAQMAGESLRGVVQGGGGLGGECKKADGGARPRWVRVRVLPRE